MNDTITVNPWIDAIFEAQQAKRDGIVRRSRKSVMKFSSEAELIETTKAREFHLIRTEKQYLIFCNDGDMKILI